MVNFVRLTEKSSPAIESDGSLVSCCTKRWCFEGTCGTRIPQNDPMSGMVVYTSPAMYSSMS